MNNSQNWFDQGVSLLEEKNFTGAITAFDKAITFNQSPVEAWFNRGVACAQTGNYQQALTSFDQTLLHDPDHENAKKARDLVLTLMKKSEGRKSTPVVTPPPQPVSKPTPALRKTVSPQGKDPIRNPLFAGIFSFFFPGWGQWYNGERWKGLGFFAVTFFTGMLNLFLSVILSDNLVVSLVFSLLGLGILVYGMYDAFTTAEKINRREQAFTRKSRLFWLPVIVIAAMIILLIMSFVLAFMVFGMAAGNIQNSASSVHHTRVVAITAQQTDASHIVIRYFGGQDEDMVSHVVITVTDSEGNSQTSTLGTPGSPIPLEADSMITVPGTPGKDQILAVANFMDGTDQVIFDGFV